MNLGYFFANGWPLKHKTDRNHLQKHLKVGGRVVVFVVGKMFQMDRVKHPKKQAIGP